MSYDLICAILLVLSFVAGFQRGVMRTLGSLLVVMVAIGFSLWITQYIMEFLHASWSQLPTYTGVVPFVTILVLSLITAFRLKTEMVPEGREGGDHLALNLLGGALLSVCMMFSLAVFSGLADQSQLIADHTKAESKAYKILNPLSDKGRQLWSKITANSHFLVRERKEMG